MTAQLPSQDDKPANPESSKSLFQTGPLRLVRKDADSVIEVPQSELTPKVQSAMRFLMSEVSRLKNELAEAKERVVSLENLADEDPLVPILNRRGFVRELERTISYAKRYAIDTSILYIDLDEFKKINDTYGHQAGDLALKHAGSYLVEKVRASDTVARIGGDEFAIILKHVRLKGCFTKSKTAGKRHYPSTPEI